VEGADYNLDYRKHDNAICCRQSACSSKHQCEFESGTASIRRSVFAGAQLQLGLANGMYAAFDNLHPSAMMQTIVANDIMSAMAVRSGSGFNLSSGASGAAGLATGLALPYAHYSGNYTLQSTDAMVALTTNNSVVTLPNLGTNPVGPIFIWADTTSGTNTFVGHGHLPVQHAAFRNNKQPSGNHVLRVVHFNQPCQLDMLRYSTQSCCCCQFRYSARVDSYRHLWKLYRSVDRLYCVSDFTWDTYPAEYGKYVRPLFVVNESGTTTIAYGREPVLDPT